jgi:hypothetical protein
VGERFPDTEEVTGSIPVSPTQFVQVSGLSFVYCGFAVPFLGAETRWSCRREACHGLYKPLQAHDPKRANAMQHPAQEHALLTPRKTDDAEIWLSAIGKCVVAGFDFLV